MALGAKQPDAASAVLQRIQALQSGEPLEPPPPLLAPVGLAEKPPKDLFCVGDNSSVQALLEKVRTAEFWISLLEGEICELNDQVAKHKKRVADVQRLADRHAGDLRESEVEKRRLQSELKWLQQTRDEAICERHLIRNDAEKDSKSKVDHDVLLARNAALEHQVVRERAKASDIEAQLVRTKVRYADCLQRADSMEVAIERYEGQLRSLLPNFEPIDLSSIAMRLTNVPSGARLGEASDDDSNDAHAAAEGLDRHAAAGRKFLKGAVTQMKRMFRQRAGGRHVEEDAAEGHTAAASQGGGTAEESVAHPAGATDDRRASSKGRRRRTSQHKPGGEEGHPSEASAASTAPAAAEDSPSPGPSPQPKASAPDRLAPAEESADSPAEQGGGRRNRKARWEMRSEE